MGERSETGTGTTIHSTMRGAYLYVGIGSEFSVGLLPICTSELGAGAVYQSHKRRVSACSTPPPATGADQRQVRL